MAEEDEIDILGDFSFNSCLAQNTQGIPSCSDREDTVHPQWLQDSVTTNWYDNQSITKHRSRTTSGSSRRRKSNSSDGKQQEEVLTTWTPEEKQILAKEMAKYGRNIRKISQSLKTKTEAEIQALIEAEFGVHLDTPSFGMEKNEEIDDIPCVVQEEIVTDDVPNILDLVATGSPTIPQAKKVNIHKRPYNKVKNNIKSPFKNKMKVTSTEIFYDDDMLIGSTESVGFDIDTTDILTQKLAKQQKEKVKAMKKIGNHRRKVSRNYDKGRRNKSKDMLKSPLGRQRKDSSLSEDSTKSPKMQIVLGSGQALPLSEGEQVIKIEKKKDSEPESDIEIDIDSDDGEISTRKEKIKEDESKEEPIAVPLRKLQPMPKRQKRIVLSGDGGYTIMHTAEGDLYEVGAEPRRPRARRPPPAAPPVPLIQCPGYGAHRPAPFEVSAAVSCLVAMDAHAHTSVGEVMGLCGGRVTSPRVRLGAYRPARAAAASTHCDMDPVSQAAAGEWVRARGWQVVGWHHSHPAFPPHPSLQDLRSQRALQRALPHSPLLGVISSQRWAHAAHTHFRIIRVEEASSDADPPLGYQFDMQVEADLTAASLPAFLRDLREVLTQPPSPAVDSEDNPSLAVDLCRDVCPLARLTYLEKLISSVSHHMRSAGYDDNDPVVLQLIQGIRDIFR